MKKADLQYPGSPHRNRRPGLKGIFLGISLILAVGLGKSVVSHFFRLDVVEEHRDILLREEKKNRELQAELKTATSAAFVEKQAREKLGLVREGDTVILVQKRQPDVSGGSSEEAAMPAWKRWWKLFF